MGKLLSDAEIIKAIESGDDESALEQLYDTELEKIKRYIISNRGKEEDAYDVFQDAVLIFYDYVKQGKFEAEHEIGAFIYSVGKNTWLNKTRKDARIVGIDQKENEIEDQQNFYKTLVVKEQEEIINKLFAELGERCSQLLVNTIFHNMSMREICDLMGFSTENAAKTKHYKCKQRLLKLIKKNKKFQNLIEQM